MKRGEKTFLSQGWDCWVISKRRSLESIPWSFPVEGSKAALRYSPCLSLPPSNLSVHFWCRGEASCRSAVPVCKTGTSICCSQELVSRIDISPGAQLSPTCSQQPSTQTPPTRAPRPSFPVNKKYRDSLELFQMLWFHWNVYPCSDLINGYFSALGSQFSVGIGWLFKEFLE